MYINSISLVDSQIMISIHSNDGYSYLTQYTPGAVSPAQVLQNGNDVTDSLKELLGSGGGGGGGSEYSGMKIVTEITDWNQEARFSVSSASDSISLPSPKNKISEKILITVISSSVCNYYIYNPTGYKFVQLPEAGFSTTTSIGATSPRYEMAANSIHRFEIDVLGSSQKYISIKHWSSQLPSSGGGGGGND